MLMYVGGVVLLRNFPFVGEVRLTVLTRFRERAIRSYRTIDMLMYVGGVVLLRNFPFVGEVRLTVLTRFRERAVL